MNAIELLQARLKLRRGAKSRLDAPTSPSGAWFLDIPREGLPPIAVEWRDDGGPHGAFGVSARECLPYEGADELYADFREVYVRVKELMAGQCTKENP